MCHRWGSQQLHLAWRSFFCQPLPVQTARWYGGEFYQHVFSVGAESEGSKISNKLCRSSANECQWQVWTMPSSHTSGKRFSQGILRELAVLESCKQCYLQYVWNYSPCEATVDSSSSVNIYHCMILKSVTSWRCRVRNMWNVPLESQGSPLKGTKCPLLAPAGWEMMLKTLTFLYTKKLSL